jgi:DHA2 family multidrug resistance protein
VRFDFVGVGFMAAGLASLVVVLEQGNRWEWFDSPVVWTLALVAVSGLLLFVYWELFGTATPAVDLRILGSPPLLAGWLSIGAVGFCLFSGLVMVSLFMQNGLGYTALQTGVQFFPRGLVSMLVSPIGGIIAGRFGPKFVVAPGLALAGTAMLMMSRWTLDAGPLQTMVPMLLLGIGFPMIVVPLISGALNAVERAKAIKAASLMNLMLQLGGSFGTAAITTIFERGTNLYHARLVEQARPDHPAWAEATRQVQALMVRGGSDAATGGRQALVLLDGLLTGQATVLSFEHVFLIIATLFFATLIAVPFLPSNVGSGPAVAVEQ